MRVSEPIDRAQRRVYHVIVRGRVVNDVGDQQGVLLMRRKKGRDIGEGTEHFSASTLVVNPADDENALIHGATQ